MPCTAQADDSPAVAKTDFPFCRTAEYKLREAFEQADGDFVIASETAFPN